MPGREYELVALFGTAGADRTGAIVAQIGSDDSGKVRGPIQPPLMTLPIETAESGFYDGFSAHVTIPAKIVVSILIVWAVVFPTHASETLSLANETIIRQFAGWYVYLVAALVLVCLALAVVPQSGSLRLGAPGEASEFSRFSWFAMLFGAGIGIGMLTYSTGEAFKRSWSSLFQLCRK